LQQAGRPRNVGFEKKIAPAKARAMDIPNRPSEKYFFNSKLKIQKTV
jgi:hypothetical protein